MECQEPESKADDEGKVIGDSSHIISSVSRFYNNDEMSDVVLKVGDKKFYAHRLVLVLMSDVFNALCSNRWNSSSDKMEIELTECEQCVPVFSVFLHYLYHGSARVTTQTALPLLMLADKYNVQPLKKSCEDYIYSQIREGNVSGALRWLPYLQLCGNEELEEACKQVVVLDVNFVLKCDQFLGLSLQFLIKIYSRDDLVVDNEHSLYLGMVRWVSSREDEDSDDCVKSLVPLIRFSMMSADQLIQVEKSQFFNDKKEIMTSYLSEAHQFRSLACEVEKLPAKYAGKLYRARNYTDGRWCLSFNVACDGSNFQPKHVSSNVANDVLAFKPFHCKTSSNDANWDFKIFVGEVNYNQFEGIKVTSLWDHWNIPSMSERPKKIKKKFQQGSEQEDLIQLEKKDTIPLLVSVRCCKQLRCHVAVDVSLFLVRNNKISALLDTKTVYGLPHTTASAGLPFFDNMSGSSSLSKVSTNQQPRSSSPPNARTPRMFQPAPMHFSFVQPSQPSHHDNYSVVLQHKLPRDWLMMPPEVPCVSFPIRFVPPRTLQGVVCVAIICKPRLQLAAESFQEDEASEV